MSGRQPLQGRKSRHMPRSRTSRFKPTGFGKRSMFKRRFRKKKQLAFKTHNFVERDSSSLTINPMGGTQAHTFSLANIYNIANYQGIFEMYKINKVVVTLRYKTSGQIAYDNTNNSINEINPTLYFKIDHNDSVADTIATLKASARTKTVQITNDRPNITIVLKPAVQEEIYKSAIASTYAPKWNQWLTMADPSVPHYGLKLNVQGPAGAPLSVGECQLEVKYYFSCKNNE